MTHCSGKFMLFTVELIKWLYLEKSIRLSIVTTCAKIMNTETRAPLFYQPSFLRKSGQKVKNERVHLLLALLKKKNINSFL